jgi:hypothetical protein
MAQLLTLKASHTHCSFEREPRGCHWRKHRLYIRSTARSEIMHAENCISHRSNSKFLGLGTVQGRDVQTERCNGNLPVTDAILLVVSSYVRYPNPELAICLLPLTRPDFTFTLRTGCTNAG